MITISKNSVEEVRIEHTVFKGHHLIDARVFYLHQDGSWRPTTKGLTLKLDLWREVLEAVGGLAHVK